MLIQFLFVIHDSATSAPVPDAKVFAFGPIRATTSGVTDADGAVVLNLEEGPLYTVSVFKAGYATTTVDLVAHPAGPFEIGRLDLSLGQLVFPRHQLKFDFSPAVAGVQWTLFDPSLNIVETGASDPSGQSLTVQDIDEGDYTFQAVLEGYDPVSEAIVVGPRTEFAFVLEKLQDSGVSLEPQDSEPQSEAIELSDASLSTRRPDDEEQIFANDAFTRYFTATLARIYIGNLFVDELHSVQFVLQQNRSPVYGYASRYPDAYSTGRSLVQGQLIINYVHSGYLLTILREYHRLFLSQNQEPSDADAILVARQDRRKLLNSVRIPENDPAVQRLDRKIQQLLLSASPESVARVRDEEHRQLSQFRDVSGYRDQVVYQDIVFDLQAEVSQGLNKMTRRLEKCVLTNNEMIYDQSGNPLQESYGFLARRLR